MKEVLHSLIKSLRYPEVDLKDLAFGIDSSEEFQVVRLDHRDWGERNIVIAKVEDCYHIRYRTLDSKTITMRDTITMTYTPLTGFEDGIYEFCEVLFEAIGIRDT